MKTLDSWKMRVWGREEIILGSNTKHAESQKSETAWLKQGTVAHINEV